MNRDASSNALFEKAFLIPNSVSVCECLFWKIVKLMVTVLNFAYYMMFMVVVVDVTVILLYCFGPIKITLSNYLKPMLFCF